MLDNKDKIYKEEKPNTTKIHLIFDEQGPFNPVYKPDEYNGKDSTFYVHEDLAEKVLQLTIE